MPPKIVAKDKGISERFLPKAGKCLIWRHDAGDDGDEQSRESHEIISNPPPDQEREDQAHENKEKYLVIGHVFRLLQSG
jgi:hypothetical protein